jgi:hypothetical protein
MPNAGDDRRAVERFPVNADTNCTFVSPVVEDFGFVRVKDISLAGIGLLIARKVEVGALLAITVANPAKSFQKTVLARVVHVTPVFGMFQVGGTFEVPLRYEELSALVM